MINKIKQDIYNNRLPIFFIILYLMFMQVVFSTFCPIKAIFNVDCPGCGLTHATIYMFEGQFEKAFNTNYTVFLWWALIILFLIDRYIKKLRIKVFPNVLFFVTIITILRFIICNVTFRI